MTLPKIGFSTVVKLLLASLAVGILLAFFDIKPEDILAQAQALVGELAGDLGLYANRALTYILLGAVIVLPLWLISYIWRAIRNRG